MGEREWADDDPAAYVWRLAAPTIRFFLWDLMQTSLAWWQHTRHKGGKPVEATDIGLALAR